MKALNAKQRNDLFFQWSLIFIVTAALVGIALFFDYDFERTDYERVKAQYTILKSEKEKAGDVNAGQDIVIVTDLISQINSLEAPGASPTNVSMRVQSGAGKLLEMGKLDSLISIALTRWNDDKLNASKLKESLKAINDKLDECSKEKDAYKKDYEDYKATHP